MSHTPGPWYAVKEPQPEDGWCYGWAIMPEGCLRRAKYNGILEGVDTSSPAAYGYETGVGYAVAAVDGYTTSEGDANLIAAAPELLEALEDIIKDHDEREETFPGTQTQPHRVKVMSVARTAIKKARGE